MIENKSDVNSENEEGDTPLHCACLNKNVSIEIIKYLVENKSDLNSHNILDSTPLDSAVENISKEIKKYLNN